MYPSFAFDFLPKQHHEIIGVWRTESVYGRFNVFFSFDKTEIKVKLWGFSVLLRHISNFLNSSIIWLALPILNNLLMTFWKALWKSLKIEHDLKLRVKNDEKHINLNISTLLSEIKSNFDPFYDFAHKFSLSINITQAPLNGKQ